MAPPTLHWGWLQSPWKTVWLEDSSSNLKLKYFYSKEPKRFPQQNHKCLVSLKTLKHVKIDPELAHLKFDKNSLFFKSKRHNKKFYIFALKESLSVLGFKHIKTVHKDKSWTREHECDYAKSPLLQGLMSSPYRIISGNSTWKEAKTIKHRNLS